MNILLKILWDEMGGTLAITRKVAATLATAAAMNTNYDEIEAVINGAIDADNIEDDAVSAAKLNSDVVRANYGLVQHTDGALYVDVSDTNPSLELTDGGLRAKVYGMINRTANGLTFGRSGDVILSSCTDTPDGWTDVSATYADKFIKISATALSTGSASATGTSDSHTLTIAEIPAHTHNVNGQVGSRWGAEHPTIIDGGTQASSSTGGGGGHTHGITLTTVSPAYVTLKMYQKS